VSQTIPVIVSARGGAVVRNTLLPGVIASISLLSCTSTRCSPRTVDPGGRDAELCASNRHCCCAFSFHAPATNLRGAAACVLAQPRRAIVGEWFGDTTGLAYCCCSMFTELVAIWGALLRGAVGTGFYAVIAASNGGWCSGRGAMSSARRHRLLAVQRGILARSAGVCWRARA